MALTSGFYNSINNDIRYDANQIGRFFDGVIEEGVFSTIYDVFSCEAIEVNKVKVKSGFGYFKGHYICNPEEVELEIDENLYPDIPISNILIKQPPNQVDYPTGNPLNLDGIIVEGVPASVPVESISIDQAPQVDYPVGNPLDLGDIRVIANLTGAQITRVGSVYIVIEIDEYNRLFTIKVIKPADYDSSMQYIIAIAHKTATEFYIENFVGKSNLLISGPKLITGLIQSTYINDVYEYIESIYDDFKTEWDNTIPLEYQNWLTEQEYYLYYSGQQYSRMNTEVNNKSNKFIIKTKPVNKDSTSVTIQDSSITDGCFVDVKSKPYGLKITNISISSGTALVSFKKADQNYTLYFIMR